MKLQRADEVSYSVSGRTVTVNSQAKAIDLYAADGQKVASSTDGRTVKAPAKGVYMLAVQAADGSKKAVKMVID